MSEIEPSSTIHSPHDKRSVAVPEPINEDSPRILAPNALDTITYGTETPETQTPPTNYTVATEESPPTDPELEPVHAEVIEMGNELPPPEGEVVNMTPDREPTKVWSGQPKVKGQQRPPRDQPTYALAHESVPLDDDDDDENEWVEDHEAEKPKKKGRPKKK